jgi:autotransporter-associated beta strand protein
VAQGTLRPGGPAAFGTVDGATTVSSGATLDVNGQSLGAEPINVSGSGVGGSGAIINSSAEQQSALRMVTLTGDTTLGGASRWDIRNTGGAATLSSAGAAYNLTKTGPNQVSLVGVAVDAALGDITIHQGLLGFETSTTSMGDPARTLTVEPGASLSFFNSTALWDKQFMLQGNGINASVTNWSGSNTMAGPVTLNGDCVFGVAGTALRCNGSVSGSGALVKQGAGPLTLAGLGDYAGLTTVSNGTLFVDGSLQSGGDVRVYRGTLAGVGVIAPSVTIGANGNLSPGNSASPFAVLQLGNNLVLAGTCTIDLNKAASPLIHDVIVFVSDMTFGGILRLNISGPPLVDGDEFVFFNFVTATGAFSRIEPASPGPGLGWDTSRLAIDGTLRVVALPTPGIAGISIVDHSVVFSGTNGLPGTTSYVLGTTNVALPLANWVRIATNVFDANGNFNFTNAVNPNMPQQFFLLQLP